MSTFPFICLLLFTTTTIITLNVECQTLHSASSSKLLSAFLNSISQIEHQEASHWQKVSEEIKKIAQTFNQSSATACYRSIERTLQSGYQSEWSAKLIQSNRFLLNGHSIFSSLISQKFTSLGDYDTCLSISNNIEAFSGKYCLVTVQPPKLPYNQKVSLFNETHLYLAQLSNEWLSLHNRFPLTFSICVPSICSVESLKQLIEKYLSNQKLTGISLEVDYCQQRNDPLPVKSSYRFNLSLTLMSICVCISVLATILTHFIGESHLKTTLNCFHLGVNLKVLFKISKATAEGQLDLRLLHGLKAVLIFITIICHCFMMMPSIYFSPIALFSNYPSFYHHFRGTLFVNVVNRGSFVVDYFFTISGFLVAYHLTLTYSKKLPNFGLYLLTRWIRSVPSVLAILGLTIIAQKLGSGPLAHPKLTEPFVAPCSKYWWTHALFISNLWTLKDMCGPNMWFLAVDYQLYIGAYGLLALYLTFKNRAIFYIISIGSILLTMTLSTAIALSGFGIPYVDFPTRFASPYPLESTRLMYTSPLEHVFPYVMGIIIALQVMKKQKSIWAKSKSSHLQLLLPLLCMQLFFLFPVPDTLGTESGQNTSIPFVLLYVAIFVINILAGSVLFYRLLTLAEDSCVKRFLSASFFLPLSRLSLSIYLLNPLLIWFNVAQSRTAQQLTIFYIVQFVCTIYFQAIIGAIFLYIFFEAPIAQLMRLVLKQTRGESKTNSGNK